MEAGGEHKRGDNILIWAILYSLSYFRLSLPPINYIKNRIDSTTLSYTAFQVKTVDCSDEFIYHNQQYLYKIINKIFGRLTETIYICI